MDLSRALSKENTPLRSETCLVLKWKLEGSHDISNTVFISVLYFCICKFAFVIVYIHWQTRPAMSWNESQESHDSYCLFRISFCHVHLKLCILYLKFTFFMKWKLEGPQDEIMEEWRREMCRRLKCTFGEMMLRWAWGSWGRGSWHDISDKSSLHWPAFPCTTTLYFSSPCISIHDKTVFLLLYFPAESNIYLHIHISFCSQCI